ncbi:CvpA family protein [candidate division KSB1 bacterium]|nr:CvpA family protein [candidate division KSB1 bacterium]RQW07570.1 MAG: CvpA family protein [candidate division KSB1 bacterium]
MIVDLIIVVILFFFCIRSFRAGIRGELLGAIGWLIAIIVAIGFSESIGGMLFKQSEGLGELGPYLSFILIIGVMRLLFMGIVKFLPETLKGAMGVLLNVAASALGFFKGAFFMSVILLLLSRTDLDSAMNKYTQDAMLYPHIKDFSRQVVHLTSEKIPNVKDVLEALG